MADLIDRQTAIEALGERPLCWSEGEWESGLIAQWEADVEALKGVPSAEPDKRIAKIEDLVDGTIDHFDLDDAMDLLYQIKGALK